MQHALHNLHDALLYRPITVYTWDDALFVESSLRKWSKLSRNLSQAALHDFNARRRDKSAAELMNWADAILLPHNTCHDHNQKEQPWP